MQNARLDELVDTFEMLGEWEERYRYLIDLGRKLPPLTPAEHSEANKVRGCMSQVWLVGERSLELPPQLKFRGDSDAHIVKGLIAVLMALYSERSPREILDTDINQAFTRLGLEGHITMNRRNGFYSMVEKIREMAAANV